MAKTGMAQGDEYRDDAEHVWQRNCGPASRVKPVVRCKLRGYGRGGNAEWRTMTV